MAYMTTYLGTNIGASQSGMTMGTPRHAADMKADNMLQESQAILHTQTGWFS